MFGCRRLRAAPNLVVELRRQVFEGAVRGDCDNGLFYETGGGAGNFRVEIGNLPCTRVAKIDSFTWKQGVTPRTGETQNLKLTLPMSDWDAWASAAKSQAGRPAAKKGTLTVSDRYAKSGYVLSFTGINIVKLTRETQSANAKRIAWFVVELHVNEIDLDFVRR